MQGDNTTEVFRSENIVARAVKCDDVSRWVITFDNYGIGHGFDRDGFSQGFLSEQGLSSVHIMGRREDWYQYPDMMDSVAAVRKYLAEAERIITYGSSMGGYAALRFADALGADAALALSPQYSIDPAKVPFETRWLQDARRIVWRPEHEPALPFKARAVVVYDPMTIDRRHIDLISEEIAVQPIPVRYSGHPSGWMVADTHLLSPLLLDVLNGVDDLSRYPQAIRAARAQSSTYLINLARALPPRRSHIALALAERAVAIKSIHVDALHCLADNLVVAGRSEEALNYYKRAVDAAHGGINGWVPYADGLSRLGRHHEAMPIVRDVTSRPEAAQLAHLHAWHGLIASQAGLKQEALQAMKKALALHPSEPTYQKLAAAYEADLSPARWWQRWLSRFRASLSSNRVGSKPA